jgi:large subunit ribosomal protein L20
MRIKAGVYSRHRKKKTFRLAKGYYGNKRNRWRMTIQQVEKSLSHAYVGRKDKKGNFRRLWIARINAACRENDFTYSRFMAGLKKAGVTLNRKMLADLAVADAVSFKQILSIARGT